jgi:hypothetical protein
MLQNLTELRPLSIKGLFSRCFRFAALEFAFASCREIHREIKGFRICNTVVLSSFIMKSEQTSLSSPQSELSHSLAFASSESNGRSHYQLD